MTGKRWPKSTKKSRRRCWTISCSCWSRQTAITPQEWEAAVQKGKLLPFLETVGIHTGDAKDVYKMLSKWSEDGRVQVQALVKTLFGLKGHATPYNVLNVIYSMNQMEKRLQKQLDTLRHVPHEPR